MNKEFNGYKLQLEQHGYLYSDNSNEQNVLTGWCEDRQKEIDAIKPIIEQHVDGIKNLLTQVCQHVNGI